MQLNLINGKVIRKNGALAFSSTLMEFFLPIKLGMIAWSHKITDNKNVYLAISPFDIKVGNCSENDCIKLLGEVISVNPFESGLMLLAQVGDETISVSTDASVQYTSGQPVHLAFNKQDAFLVRIKA